LKNQQYFFQVVWLWDECTMEWYTLCILGALDGVLLEISKNHRKLLKIILGIKLILNGLKMSILGNYP